MIVSKEFVKPLAHLLTFDEAWERFKPDVPEDKRLKVERRTACDMYPMGGADMLPFFFDCYKLTYDDGVPSSGEDKPRMPSLNKKLYEEIKRDSKEKQQ